MHGQVDFPWRPTCPAFGGGNSSTLFLFAMSALATLRTRAFFAQQCRCIYCELPIWEPAFGGRLSEFAGLPDGLMEHLRCTAEHFVARQKVKLDHPVNIAAACHWCNWKRHAHRHLHAPDPIRYQAEVRRMMAVGLWHPAARWIARGLSAGAVASERCRTGP